MENLALVSILALIAAIVLGFIRKVNVGIVSIGFALLLSLGYGIKTKEIISGFNTGLFLTMAGVTYLFCILNQNGTLKGLADCMVHAACGKRWLIPVAMYLMGALLSAAGPGSIPILAIIPVVAVPVAVSAGMNPLMLAIIGQCGCFGGRMTSITPEGILTLDLMSMEGTPISILPIWLSLLVSSLVLALTVFVFYRGWRDLGGPERRIKGKAVSFGRQQVISLLGLCAMLIGVLVFKINVGLLSFLIGSVLIMCGAAKEGHVIKGIPWNILLLVIGVGMLMKIVTMSGGIKLLADAMASVMTGFTASAVMTAIAGIMSFFSSGLGVVFPTLIPTVTGIAAHLGGSVSAVELAAAVVIGGTMPGLSPISTTGGLIMAAVESEHDTCCGYTANRMFIELWAWAFAALVISCALALCGIYTLLCA